MRVIDWFLAFISNFSDEGPANWQSNEHAANVLPTPNDYVGSTAFGFALSDVVLPNRKTFSLNMNTRNKLRLNSEDSKDRNLNVKVKQQIIPRYKYKQKFSSEAVLEEWHSRVWSTSEVHADRNSDNWNFDNQLVPDITDKDTMLTFAYLAANAYVPIPHEGDWTDVDDEGHGGWRHDDGYGWDDDGLRGYIFTSNDSKTLIMSIKGTSTTVFEDGGPTVPTDKLNDNLLFSCCCARVSYLWDTVCDCYMGNGQCDERCLEKELYREDRYYRQVLGVFDEAMSLYPNVENVWITGHSLGGALSSLLGRTYGLPVVTFEAPGEHLAVKRLHLPQPPGVVLWDDYVWHFGHNADPIFTGSCSGSSSSCSMKGYAMETVCHSGQVCVYNVKEDLGWHESVVNHRIHIVIDDVLEKYDEPAKCISIMDCTDCSNWEFIDPMDTHSTNALPSLQPTSSISTSTTTSSSLHTSTTHTTTSTTSTTSIVHTKPFLTATESCVEHGWYGNCKEYTTITYTATPDPPTPPLTTTSCVERAWYGACESYTTFTARGIMGELKVPETIL